MKGIIMDELNVQTESEIFEEGEKGGKGKPEAKLIQISGLWLNKDKNGDPYFTGYLGNAKIFIFKNQFKEADNHPDYVMSIGENKKKEKVDADNVTF